MRTWGLWAPELTAGLETEAVDSKAFRDKGLAFRVAWD